MLRLYTFGGLRTERDGQPLQLSTQKGRDLLAYLIAFRDRSHPRSVLAGILWPDLPEVKARRRLSDTLWRVRRPLGDLVMADEERVWFNAEALYWLDVQEFELEMQRAGGEGQSDDLRIPHLISCVQLYVGPFLDGLYHDWVLVERERLQELYLKALERLLEHHKQIGDYAEALSIAQQLVATEPLHEASHRELMHLYHLLDRDAEAIAQYDRCCGILQEELGVSPAPETEALYQALSGAVPSPSTMPTPHLPTSAHRPTYDLDELPLVGRDGERSALLAHLESAAAGQGGIVLLEGEAGIGKSRLAQELVAGARWRNIDAILVSAGEEAAPSYGLLVAALAPILSPLRIRQVAHLLDPIYLQVAVPLLPCIGQGLPDPSPLPDLPPAQAHERLQQALVAILLALSRIAPHLWILEDIQWADAETLSLLPLLPSRLRESRALLLLTGRSAELRANPAVWRTLQALDRVAPLPRYTLPRLNADDLGMLVRNLLNKDDPTLTNCLAQESEGVPLYAVETLKVWRDEEHLLPGEGGGWQWRGDVLISLPSQSGEAIIGHHLSHLSLAAEEMLAAAAVIGTEIDFDLLARVCTPPDEADIEPYLPATDDLLLLGFLVETDKGYRFSHEQVRRAVYQRLPLSQRQSLHRRVARAAESLLPDQLELLAHHYIAAGEREPAIHYLNRAAEHARQLFAHQAALTFYGRLLDLLTHPTDRAARYDVLCDRAEVLDWIGDRDAQGHVVEEMIHLARDLSDEARLARALYLRSKWQHIQGRYEPANQDALAALEIYRRLGDERGRAHLLTQIGRNLLYTDDCRQATAYFRRAIPILEAVGDLKGQIECLTGLAYIAQYGGDFPLTMTYYQHSLALAEATDDVHRVSEMLSKIGIAYVDLGDIDAADAHLRRALQLAEASGDRRMCAITQVRLGHVAIQRYTFEAARMYLQAALETFRAMQDPHWMGLTLSVLGEVVLLLGDSGTAKGHLEAARRCHVEIGAGDDAVVDLSYLSRAEAALGDEAAAWEHSQQVVAKMEAEWSGTEQMPEIYYNHFCVAEATRHWAAARAALEGAANLVNERAALINDPAWRESYRTGLRVNRVIAAALADQPSPGQLRVCLARADAPAHRRPAPDETVTVIWTVDAGEEDATLAKRQGKAALRRHRLLRLLREAEAAGALPAIADLAGALDVSPRTIRADLAALRRQEHAVRTRGRAA
jgi:DNA-binding SARP family transcriptional activator/tetratricopeptide (TPR) repeat protein